MINGTVSPNEMVTSGVPQGSILGPLLFIMYINTMDRELEGLVSIISKFADDTKIGSVVKNQNQVDDMHRAVVKLEDWAKDWLMTYNESKCKVLHFGRQNPGNVYSLNNTVLERSDIEKDIGVIIHESLKPADQCTRAAWAANCALGQMSRALHVRDAKTWTKLYTTYIRPYLEYSTPAWSPWARKDIEVLEKVQQRALRQITTLGHLSYHEKLNRLGLTTLEERRMRTDMIQVWKILNNHDDVEETIWFTRAQEVSQRQTRQNSSVYS